MTGLFSRLRMRAAIGLVAAYAVALQAVFTTLAPMPAMAAGQADPFAAHCFGSGNAGLPEDGEPGAPSPAAGKHCVFCGACSGGFVVLPSATGEAKPQPAAPIAFVCPADIGLTVAGNPRDGPARAPPPTS